MPIFYSPAKINLFLRVLHKRADGYHELASLFQAISLADKLTVSFANQDSFTIAKANLPTDTQNLVIRSRDLFRQKTGLSTPVALHLEKHIPMEAGLGGGSSNAATTLWALNALHGSPVSTEELQLWGAELGSDVPFFFSSGTAYCTGRGEQVLSCNPLAEKQLTIVKPSFGLSTPKVYAAFRSTNSPDPMKALNSWQAGEPLLFNDLELAAFGLAPELVNLKQALSVYGPTLLSGSGTSLFCLTEAKPSLANCQIFPAYFSNRSPDNWY